MADVFVSYCRRDRPRVAPLVAAIESKGWSVWWDPEIVPGQEFDRMIHAELASAGAVLAVWTKDSVESRWVRGEAREGADRGILVPVRLEMRRCRSTCAHSIRSTSAVTRRRSAQPAGPGDAACARRADRARRQDVIRPAGVRSGSPAASAIGSDRVAICVLPFANMGGDPEQAYFSDGITEDIITELSRWRMLAVRSRSASFRYRGAGVDVQQVARELNVRFIVEGSVRRMGERIRITAQLIDTETGNHVWAEKFDRELADIFNVQDQVVQTIVSTLVGRVQASDVERAAGNRRRAWPPTSAS